MTTVTALQETLAAEHATLQVVALLGARTSRSGAPALHAALEDSYVQHRAQRDRLTQEVRDRGADPVAAEPAYTLPTDVATVAAVQRHALELEQASAASYAALVAHTTGPLRRWAVAVLTVTAVRGLAFRGVPETFPGLASPRSTD